LDTLRFRKIISIFRHLGISWDVTNGMRPEGLDEDILKEIKESGCIRLSLAPESGSPRVLRSLMNKDINLKEIEKVLYHCRKLGIPVLNYFVVGIPGESLTEIRQTIDYALGLFRKYGSRAGISLATPLPGTRLYEIAKKDGLLCVPETPESYAKGPNSAGMIRTQEFCPSDLSRELARFKIRYAWLDAVKNRSFTSFKHLVKMLLKKLP
jgi:magnesium-protoporphyrin IX monomethyl ester (oxidative) cyclase